MLDILDVAFFTLLPYAHLPARQHIPPGPSLHIIPSKRSMLHPTSLYTLYLGSDQSTCSTKLPSAGVAYEIFSLKRNG
jgi:hypothetical protein